MGCEVKGDKIECYQKVNFGVIHNDGVCAKQTKYFEKYYDTTRWYSNHEDRGSVEKQVFSFLQGMVFRSHSMKLERISVDKLTDSSEIYVYCYAYSQASREKLFYFLKNEELIVVGNMDCRRNTYVRLDKADSKDIIKDCIFDIAERIEKYENQYYPVPKE